MEARLLVNDKLLFTVVILTWGLWGIIEKKILSYTDTASFLLVYTVLQSLINIPLYYFVMKSNDQIFVLKKEVIIFSVLLILILAVGDFAHAELLRKGTAGRVISLTSVYPIITMILSAVFFKEIITIRSFGGVILICLGLILVR
ncbi:EamA family transporter [Fusibacter sp. JL216-2]|uniref:EamA family transporter n=1 Tax=Fusibacter sp. JL216-2 TaxID=3071453 RepID=UPI003D352C76